MLKEAIINHYKEEEIVQAKKALCDAAVNLIPECEDLKKSRVNSSTRESYVAETEDIIHAMELLVNIPNRDQNFPRFVALDPTNLPCTAPETANWMTVMEQMEIMQREIRNMKSSVEANRLEILEQKASSSARNPQSYAARVRDSGQSTQPSQGGQGPRRPGAPGGGLRGSRNTSRVPGGNGSTQVNTHSQQLNTTASNANTTDRQVRVSTDGTSDDKQNDNTHTEEGTQGSDHCTRDAGPHNRQDTWQEVQRKVQRKKKVFSGIVGTKQECRITSGPVNIDIKIWNITPTYGPEHIKDVITAEGVDVKDVVELSKPEWRTRSFKVSIAANDRDKVFNPEMWSAGVRIGRYYAARRPRLNVSHNNNG